MKTLFILLSAWVDGNYFAGFIKENGDAYLILFFFFFLSLISMILSHAIFRRRRIAIDDTTTGLAVVATVFVLAGYIICFDISFFTFIVGLSATTSACLAALAAVLNLSRLYKLSVTSYYIFMLSVVISVI